MDLGAGTIRKMTKGTTTYNFSYNANGLPDIVSNNVTSGYIAFQYDQSNLNLENYTDFEGNTCHYDYDTLGKIKSFKDGKGNSLSFEYDAAGQRTKITDRNNKSEQMAFLTNGLLKQYTDKNGYAYQYNYDKYGNVIKKISPDGSFTLYRYDAVGLRLTSMTDAMGYITSYKYDNLDRVTEITNPDSTSKKFKYDCCAQVEYTDESGKVSSITRNALEQVTQTTDAEGNIVKLNYDNLGRLNALVFPGGKTKNYTHNDFGKVLTEQDEDGNICAKTYDGMGELAEISDATKNIYSILRDKNSRIIQLTFPDGSNNSYTYNANGKPKTKVSSKKDTVSFGYDAEDQVTSLDAGLQHYTYIYDANGQLTGHNSGKWAETYAINSVGSVSEITYTNATKTLYSYDKNNKLVDIKYPMSGPHIMYKRDNKNRVKAMYIGNKDSIIYIYDAVGKMTLMKRSNNAVSKYTYSATGKINDIVHFNQTDTFAGLHLTRDARGSIVFERRITPSIDSSSIIPSDTGGFYNKGNELGQWHNDKFEYDKEGNLIKITGSKSVNCSYNELNNLTSIDINGSQTTIEYNALGLAAQKTSGGKNTIYYYDGNGNLLVSIDQSGNDTSFYIYDDKRLVAVSRSGKIYHYHFNQVGSTVAITDPTGSVASYYSYNPWGKLTLQHEGFMQPFKFSGAYGVREELPDYYLMRNRFYLAPVGRFIQRDPIGLNGGYNLYTYANNDPLGKSDPLGLLGMDDPDWGVPDDKPISVEQEAENANGVAASLDVLGFACDFILTNIPGVKAGVAHADGKDWTEIAGSYAGDVLECYLKLPEGEKAIEKLFKNKDNYEYFMDIFAKIEKTTGAANTIIQATMEPMDPNVAKALKSANLSRRMYAFGR